MAKARTLPPGCAARVQPMKVTPIAPGRNFSLHLVRAQGLTFLRQIDA